MFKKQKSEIRIAYDAAMDGYRSFLKEFVPRHVADHGSPPTVDQRVCEYARTLGWAGTYSFGGLSDEPQSGEYKTHHEAIVNSIARDSTGIWESAVETPRLLENRRRQVSPNLEEFYVVAASLVMRDTGRLLAFIPGFFRAQTGEYTNFGNLWEISATAALFSSGSAIRNPHPKVEHNVWSAPKWATDAVATPLCWVMQFNPWTLTDRRNFKYKIEKVQPPATNSPRVLEEFVQFKSNSELNLVEMRLRELGNQFGFESENEWRERLAQQPWNRSGLGNKVNLQNETSTTQAMRKPHTVKDAPPTSPIESKLAEIKQLLKDGLIDQAEHDALRRKILGI